VLTTRSRANTPLALAPAATTSFVVLLVLVLLLLLSSCARTTVDGTGANPNVYAGGICNYLARCNPAFVRSYFSDVPTCTSAFILESTKLITARGSTITKKELDACIVKTESVACGEDIESLPECDFKGSLVDGDACSSGVQCASGSCFKTAVVSDGGPVEAVECGVCSTRVGEAGSCTNAACAPGLDCLAGTCVAPSDVGGPCDDAGRRCRKNFACVQGACALTRARDESCSPSAPCDSAQGLACLNGKCVTVAAKAGGSCERHPFCEASYCSSVPNPTCVALKEEGASCERTTECAFPFDCRAGRCTKSDPTACR
jgi:hypothetical protein